MIAFALSAVSWCERYAKSIELLRLLECESGGIRTARSLVTRIRGCGGVAAPELLCQRTVGDDARPPAVANTGELAVPVFQGQPDLEEDLRFARWGDDAGYAAERRQVADRIRRTRRRERARGNGLSRRDRRVGKLLSDQARAGGAGRSLRDGPRNCQRAEDHDREHSDRHTQAGRQSHCLYLRTRGSPKTDCGCRGERYQNTPVRSKLHRRRRRLDPPPQRRGTGAAAAGLLTSGPSVWGSKSGGKP